MPLELPSDLTVPEPGSGTLRRIFGLYLKRSLSDLQRLPAGRFDSQMADDFGVVRAVIERLSRSGDAGLVFSILRRVSVSTALRCVDGELWAGGDVGKLDTWLSELTGLLAFELAAAGALPATGLRLRRRPERLVSLARGVALWAAPDWNVTFVPDGVVLDRGTTTRHLGFDDFSAREDHSLPGVRSSRPYHTIVEGIRLALVDTNPISDLEAHPDKAGNALSLGDRPVDEWVQSLRAAYELVERHLPAVAEEMRLLMQLVIPVGYDRERHLSASYGEAIGACYLSLHPDPMTMAEALVHEFSHNKLNALMRLDAVLENAHSPLFSSPVRPDPRPLSGVLLAAHAFTPVACLYERMLLAGDPLSRSPSFVPRYERIAEGNHAAMVALLEHGRATPVGLSLIDELRRWDEHHAAVRRGSGSQPSP
jgi:HEXXH motif-containing protein